MSQCDDRICDNLNPLLLQVLFATYVLNLSLYRNPSTPHYIVQGRRVYDDNYASKSNLDSG